MNFSVIARLLGILICMFSFTMLIPALVALFYHDGNSIEFIVSFLITISSGLILWFPNRSPQQKELGHRGGFLITALFWVVLGSFGAIPFLLSTQLDITITDAIFESLSGLTTTGATVISGLDTLPRSLLYYRQQLQWLGGIGIIVIAVAILPILGIGGMQLYRAEIPGPNKDEKLTPRITQTAKWIFLIYVFLTASCALAYWLAGMTLFDAICHSFSTIAIGGFSTHDASIAFFDSHAIMYIASFFMLISAINFTLHYYTMVQRKPLIFWKDTEARTFIIIAICASLIAIIGLSTHNNYAHKSDYWAQGVFHAVSLLTTTGFTADNFSNWPTFLPVWLILLSVIGGCAGSTAGGMKVIRIMIMFKQGARELFLLIHPNAISPIKFSRKSVPPRVISAIWSFVSVYFYVLLFIMVILMMTGLDFTTAFSATLASLNNLGPGLGEVSAHYQNINATAKWILCLAMLLGRLEIFTLLVLLSPEFWKK